MQFIWADDIDEYGTAHLVFTHASEYTIVIDKDILQSSLTAPKTGEEEANGIVNIRWMMLACMVFAAGSIFLILKKKEQVEGAE